MNVDLELHGDTHLYYVLDVFTDTPLAGNQLGVFVDGAPFASEQMQAIARELNVSETVFLLAPEQGGDARMRIFTPTLELPFAGHPILGTFFVVGAALALDEVSLETASGIVRVRLQDGFGWMEQRPAPAQPYERADELLAALGLEGSLLPVEVYENGPRHVFVQLPDDDALAALRPDHGAIGTHERVGVNCFAGGGTRWTLRMFGAALGMTEDPATGSAAGPLAVHLGRHGLVPFGAEIEIHQGAAIGRPSLLHAKAESPERVEVGGTAVVVARGRYRT